MRIMEVGKPVQHTGFSLVGLLVVIAGLFGLLIPAVQEVRASRASCPELSFGIDPIISLYPEDNCDERMIFSLRTDGCFHRNSCPRI